MADGSFAAHFSHANVVARKEQKKEKGV